MPRARSAALLAGLASVMGAASARAYPQTIAKGYSNCGTCHYSPTGGGLPNAYGHATLEATFPNTVEVEALQSLREWLPKGEVTGYDDDGAVTFDIDAGIDGRLLVVQMPIEANAGDSVAVIPMLLEGGVVIGVGPALAYATVTVRRVGASPADLVPFSREHWLQVRLSDTFSLRAGRMVLPFGLRIPDHTQYTREDLGFGKWDQSYALEVDAATEDWSLAAALFAGDLLTKPLRLQERGGVASFVWNLPARASFGASFLGAWHTLGLRAAGSVFARVRFWERTYALGEAALSYTRSTTVGPEQVGLAGMLRLGWFVVDSLDVYIELGGHLVPRAFELTKLRYVAGVNWQLLPWLELAPAVMLEETPEVGQIITTMGQIHAIY